MPSLKSINAQAGTRFKRWKELTESLREQQMAESDKWYGWEHYGPKEGWKVESIRLTSMPHYWQDDNGGWNAEGSIGVNVIGEMPNRPQYVKRDGYALRIDVESIEWYYRFTSESTGAVQEVGWSHQELVGGLSFTVPRSPIWFLQDGELWKVQAWARPRLRRAKYGPDAERTTELWSSQAAGIGESEPGDTVTESAEYYIQWHEEQYEMLSWPVGGEKPVSHVPWYEPPASEPEPDSAFAKWVTEKHEKLQAAFPHLGDAWLGQTLGWTEERVKALKGGTLGIEQWERENIAGIMENW